LIGSHEEAAVPEVEPAKRGPGRPATGVREAILAAALELIGELGLARLTTREVARRAGVSEASVFYHYRDKIGLIQAVTLAGLEPLKALDQRALAGRDRPLDETLRQIATALESFFDNALPILETVQADTALRADFASRLQERNLGPHRGVRLLTEYLAGMTELGLVRPDVDLEAAALLLVGACFLRSWLRHLTGGQGRQTLPGLDDTVGALARLLTPVR
jgi:AcrR family transcriptional regulator